MQIDLTDAELALLRDILRSSYDDLREEVYKTEGSDYKRELKAREQVIRSLIQKVGPA